jgi:type II secretory pathway pseudopilin PulG
MGRKTSTRKSSSRAFNLIEVLIAVFILVCMSLMFAAVVPSTLRTVKTSNHYTLASVIAQRKLDQLTDSDTVGYANLTSSALQGATAPGFIISKGGLSSGDACEWFDPAPTQSGTFGAKDYKLTGYFTKLDGLRRVKDTPACSPRSSENAFPGGDDVQGILEITGWQGQTAGSTDSPMMRATITITWKNPGQGKSRYTTSALIPRVNIL